jgi:pyridinium-3,5-biscarboxylic acid mononucleotide sulfurtransferase
MSEAMILDTDKTERLNQIVIGLRSALVAFSGGADSTLLLAVCLRNLGRDRVAAVTADSPSLPRQELAETTKLALELGVRHIIAPTAEMQDERFTRNPVDRCFYCKQELFAHLRTLADLQGFRHLVYGATRDDLGDYRPGLRAARDAGAIAPLLEAGFTKQDVRDLSRQLGLRTWDKPAMACLASRFPYGERITAESLSQVERAEDLLRRQLGFSEVRVRHHGAVARIEVSPADFPRLVGDPVRSQVVDRLKELGFLYVTLDLEGYRTGSMNDVLKTGGKP